ncbi:hypothetical protein V5F77_04285 [Xanthobacter sp. DSM 24535]|uniref:hypothetical protein n=1 Tax=Roseixanthobacter psychrophilus TaxID=3119917 RepID=UPI00372759AB
MTPPYPAGTRIRAECTEYVLTGELIDDITDFDGKFRVRDDEDGRVRTLNGWLWIIYIEIKDEEGNQP